MVSAATTEAHSPVYSVRDIQALEVTPLPGSAPRKKINITSEGDRVFLGESYDAFAKDFTSELEKLRAENPDAYRRVVVGMAQIIAYKDLYVAPEIFRKGVPEIDPFKDMDMDSASLAEKLYDKIPLIIQQGVTFKTIESMGNAHQGNAEIIYQNALIQFLPEIDAIYYQVLEDQKKAQSVLRRINLIGPRIVSLDPHLISIGVINDTGVPVDGLSVELVSTEEAGPPVVVKVQFEKELLNGEFRAIDALSFTVAAGEDVRHLSKDTHLLASVVDVITKEDWDITGAEYDQLVPAIKNLRDNITGFQFEIGSQLVEAMNGIEVKE